MQCPSQLSNHVLMFVWCPLLKSLSLWVVYLALKSMLEDFSHCLKRWSELLPVFIILFTHFASILQVSYLVSALICLIKMCSHELSGGLLSHPMEFHHLGPSLLGIIHSCHFAQSVALSFCWMWYCIFQPCHIIFEHFSLSIDTTCSFIHDYASLKAFLLCSILF